MQKNIYALIVINCLISLVLILIRMRIKNKAKAALTIIQVVSYILGGGVFLILSNINYSNPDQETQIALLLLAIVLKFVTLIQWDGLTFKKFMLLQKAFLVPYTILGVTLFMIITEAIYVERYTKSDTFKKSIILKVVSFFLAVFACSLLMNYRFISSLEFYAYMLTNSASVIDYMQNNLQEIEKLDKLLSEGKLQFIGEVLQGVSQKIIGCEFITINSIKDIYIASIAYIIAYKLVIMDFLTQPYAKYCEKKEKKRLKKQKKQKQNDLYLEQGNHAQSSELKSPTKSIVSTKSNQHNSLSESPPEKRNLILLNYGLKISFCISFLAANLLIYIIPIIQSYDSEKNNEEIMSEKTGFVLSKVLPVVLLSLGILAKFFVIIQPLNQENSFSSQQKTTVKQKREGFSVQNPRRPLYSLKGFLKLQFAFIIPYTVMAITCWTVYRIYQLYEVYDANDYTLRSQGLTIAILILLHFSVSLVNSALTLSQSEFYTFTCALFVGNLLLTFEILRVIFTSNGEIDEYGLPIWNSLSHRDLPGAFEKIDEVKGLLLIKDLRMFQIAISMAGLLIQLDFLGRRKEQIEEEHQRNEKIASRQENSPEKLEIQMHSLYTYSIAQEHPSHPQLTVLTPNLQNLKSDLLSREQAFESSASQPEQKR